MLSNLKQVYTAGKVVLFSVGVYQTILRLREVYDLLGMFAQEKVQMAQDFVNPPPRRFVDKVLSRLDEAAGYLVDMDWLQWAMVMCFIILCVAIKSRGRKTVHYLRGIRYEAMVPGSKFVEGKMLNCQVQILLPGLLMDTHNGFGFRVDNFLVVPAHVLSDHDEFVLKSARGKVLTALPTRFPSKILSDLVYIPLHQDVWSTLSVAKASFTSLIQHASVYGLKGTSTGFLRKTNVMGQLAFHGSTIPGMSGSVYYYRGSVIGVHIGYLDDSHNIGYYGLIIKQEAAKMVVFVGETVNSLESHFDRQEEWDNKDASQYVDDAYSKFQNEQERFTRELDEFAEERKGELWAEDDDDEPVFGESAMKDEKAIRLGLKLLEKEVAAVRSKKSQRVKFHAPGEEEAMIPMTDVGQSKRIAALEAQLGKIHGMIERLDARVSKLERDRDMSMGLGKKVVEKYKCDVEGCLVECNTALKLENHKYNAHQAPIECVKSKDGCRFTGTMEAVKQHILSEHSKRLFECAVCRASFEQQEALKSHLLVHIKGESVCVEVEAAEEVKENPKTFLGRGARLPLLSKNTSQSFRKQVRFQRGIANPYQSTTESLRNTK